MKHKNCHICSKDIYYKKDYELFISGIKKITGNICINCWETEQNKKYNPNMTGDELMQMFKNTVSH